MFAPFFDRDSITVPVSIFGYNTNDNAVKQMGVYLFGIRVAVYTKIL